MLAHLPKRVVVLGDRLYGVPAFIIHAWAACQRVGSHLLFRIPRHLTAETIKRLPDGSRRIRVAVREKGRPSHIQQCHNDVLQSHTLVTAAQEIAAIVLATALLARERARVATGQIPAWRVKFGVVLAVVRSMWFYLGPCEDLLTARQKDRIVERGEALMRRSVTTPRRSRTNPRAVRQPVRKWPRLMDTHSVEGPMQFKIV